MIVKIGPDRLIERDRGAFPSIQAPIDALDAIQIFEHAPADLEDLASMASPFSPGTSAG